NPPGHKTLGMIIPQATSPMSRGGWGVLVSYNDDGHISDEDAAKIDYAELLKQMQDEDEEANKDRRKQGYAGLQLLGWAEPPRYDDSTHKMYWARELKADDAQENTLNYSIRVLGRQGVLELNAVASMSDLPTIQRELPNVLEFTNFTDGNRYADYQPGTDKLAKYGLAALVAGGIASKAGLFAKLGLLLLAAKKFIVVGLLVVASFFRKLFNRKK
ncbi:MAG: rane protein, partial [Pseudomonas sp.]|nr:rane protein [Pseudomonas sp.]